MAIIPGKDNKLEYSTIKLGKDIVMRRKKCTSSGRCMQWKSLLLQNVTNGFMVVVGYKHEFLDSNPDLIVVDGSNQQLLDDNINDVTAYKPSGIVVLCLMKLEREQIHSQYLWGLNDAVNIKKCKTNIITGHSTHFGSTGKYYSFGNRANYGMIDKSSITQYVLKKYNKLSSMITAEQQSQVMEELLANDLYNGVMSLVSIVPNLKQYIAPSLNIAFQLQQNIGDCNLKATRVKKAGLWQSSICVNCQTSMFHTENDCTYTVISTPNQNTDVTPVFLFELKKVLLLDCKWNLG